MMPCPRCKGNGSVYAAGNRIARPCPSCDGKGVITEFDASFGEADREIARLENQVRDQKKRIAELEAENARQRGVARDARMDIACWRDALSYDAGGFARITREAIDRFVLGQFRDEDTTEAA